MQFPCDNCPYKDIMFANHKDPNDALYYLDREYCYKCGEEDKNE